MSSSISIIGSGNVAHHIAEAFYKQKNNISQIYSRNIKKAKEIAQNCEAQPISDLNDLHTDTNVDFTFVCVSDDAIDEIASKIKVTSTIVHTSGSTSISILEKNHSNCGVFWPLKSIKKQESVSFSNIPICIEASNTETEKELKKLASSISNRVYVVNSEQRKIIHLSAVIANNFSNFFYSIAEEILNQHQLDFSMLTPLIIEASQQIEKTSPKDLQTGPAIRNDKNTIENHLKLLNNNPEYRNLYKFVSESIIKKYKTKQ